MSGGAAAIEIWGGIECTVNRVGDCYFDQIVRAGHDRRIDDLDRFASLGLRAIRYPVLWERQAPRHPDEIDWSWSDERLARLRDLGVRPVVGLVHHGSGPRYTSLADPAFPALLAGYARAVAERYPWITDYTPLNEPLTTARFSGLYGHWYPHARDNRTFVRIFLNQMRATALSMAAVREITPHAQLIQTEDCGLTFGTPATARQVAFEQERRWLTWDVLTGRVDAAHPMYGFLVEAGAEPEELAWFERHPTPPDVIGLNYYVTSDRYLDERLERYPQPLHGGNGTLRYVDAEAVRARPEGIHGHERHLMDAWQRYGLPVAITEVHLGCTREDQVRWLLEAWSGAHRARAAGADVRAVTAWALLGSFDWNVLVTAASGHYEVGAFDVRGPEPRSTAVAATIRAIADGRTPHAAGAGEGWWRRGGAASCTSGPPVVIFGVTGTLGYALRQICAARGLRSYAVTRAEADISDPSAVDAVLRRVEPWAVINAAGYVRVDDAEREPDACWHANVTGPLTLAAACRRRGLPLVSFSSDLVFDGETDRPYTERDPVRPLNVYGRSKAEAERRIFDLLPDALVIRTSAFFGPWDDYNFLAALLRAIDSDQPFDGPEDSTVSPTYVPHLAHATLDLLLDGERGIWHLANAGALTWHDFAVQAAGCCGWPPDRVRRVGTGAVWGPAPRPRYSALASDRGGIMPTLEAGLTEWAEARRAQLQTRRSPSHRRSGSA